MADLVIYDTEATDADARHGQITQFGAIRADAAMNALAECEIRVRRLPWVVPMPKALEVTRMRAADLDEPGRMSEYAASAEIEKFLVPGYGVPRTLITFNGPRFDDELIRTTLFRNLRNPWFSSGKLTTKIDLLSVVRLAHAHDPSSIVVPATEEGGLTWKLDRLCPANGIEIDAHDALGDARATLDLARLIARRCPEAWAAAETCGLPSKVESFMATASASGRPVYLFTHFGQPEVIPCAVLGTDGKKKWVMADLRAESRPRETADISAAMYSRGTPYPVIRSNAAPMFIDAAMAAAISPGLDPAAIAARSMTIKIDASLRTAAVDALKDASYEAAETQTSEELIYSGFVPDADKPSMTAFHRAAGWEEKLGIQFRDRRLADFSARILLDAASRGETVLSDQTSERLSALCSEALARPHAGAGARWATIESGMAGGADDDWISWADAAFRTQEPALPVPMDEQHAPAQLEMF